jgi:hypothetical protein
VFANASLFHVPSQELPRILLELRETLRPRGVLFCSNPRGNSEEGFSDGRYSCFFDLDTWGNYVAGFFEVRRRLGRWRMIFGKDRSEIWPNRRRTRPNSRQ